LTEGAVKVVFHRLPNPASTIECAVA